MYMAEEEGEVIETPTEEPVVEPAPEVKPQEEPSAPVVEPEKPAPEAEVEPPTEPARPARASKRRESVGAHMRQVVQARKRDRLEHIMDFARQKRVVKNQDVKLLLTVSDATASRYLKELVQKGELKQLGRGRGARYELL